MPVPRVNEVDFGSLRRVTPISNNWGFDRGRPVDRHYIEAFLARHSDDIHGRVLEIGDDTYTRIFGGDRVSHNDILHIHAEAPRATIVGDLATANHIPPDTFDCIILTQTLQLVFDVQAAVRTLHRILKPGGIVLATAPGISQTYDEEWGSSWYWTFTPLSLRRLFEQHFAAEDICIESFGNVLAAMSFLYGIAAEELSQVELDHREPGYDVSITVRALKSERTT